MQIEPGVYLVASGRMGFDLTDPFDCNVYLFDAGAGLVLFDTGAGMGAQQMLAVCANDGIDPHRIEHVFLTHAHADHAGGLACLRDHLSCVAYAGERTAQIVASGDAEAVSLPAARHAGVYPLDYVYQATPVQNVLRDGDRVDIGELRIEAIVTPGHSHDHLSYLVTTPSKRYLISGDAIFHGGKIVLQHTYDCSVPATIASIQRLATYDFEALLPGHMNFSLQQGKRHIDTACAIIDQLGCPPALS